MRSILWKVLDALGWIWCVPEEQHRNPLVGKYLRKKLPIFWVMGPRYCGKTTLANNLSEITGYRLIRCSRMIKEKLAKGGYEADVMQCYIDGNGVVADEIVINLIIADILSTFEQEIGYIIDGFPIDFRQAKEFVSNFCKPKIIIYVCLLDTDIVDRAPGNNKDQELVATHNESMQKFNEIYRAYEHKTLKIVTNKPPHVTVEKLVKYLNKHYGYDFT